MNEGWIKLYRKSKDNPIMQDPTAWTIFCWILMYVNRNTGEMTLGRKWASKELGIKPITFYKSLKRLQKKYLIVDLVTSKVTIKYTIVRVLNWSKYQLENAPVTQGGNNPVTIREQSSNNPVTHIQEYKNKRIKNREDDFKKSFALPETGDIDILREHMKTLHLIGEN